MAEAPVDDLPPGYSSSDVVGSDLPPGYKASDVVTAKKKPVSLIDSSGKSTYMPSETAGPAPGASPFKRGNIGPTPGVSMRAMTPAEQKSQAAYNDQLKYQNRAQSEEALLRSQGAIPNPAISLFGPKAYYQAQEGTGVANALKRFGMGMMDPGNLMLLPGAIAGGATATGAKVLGGLTLGATAPQAYQRARTGDVSGALTELGIAGIPLLHGPVSSLIKKAGVDIGELPNRPSGKDIQPFTKQKFQMPSQGDILISPKGHEFEYQGPTSDGFHNVKSVLTDQTHEISTKDLKTLIPKPIDTVNKVPEIANALTPPERQGEANAPIPQERVQSAGEEVIRPSQAGENIAGGRVGEGAGNQAQIQEPAGAQAQVAPLGDYATGARKSITIPERTARNLPEVEMQAYKTYPQGYMEGRDAVSSGLIDPRSLAHTISSYPRAMKPSETGALVYDRMRLSNALKDAYGLADDALARGDTTKAAEVKNNIPDILDALDTNDQALRKGGREASSALSAFQMAVKDDYSLGTVLQKARVKYDGQVPEEVNKQVRDLQSQLEQAQAKLDAYSQPKPVRRAINPRSREFGASNTLFTSEMADAARQRIQAKTGTLSAGIDPEILKDAVIVGGYYVEGGLRSFASWAKQMKSDFPKLDDDHIKAAWTELTNDKRLEAAKKRVATSQANIEQQIAAGGQPPIKPPEIKYDTDYLKLRNTRDSLRNKLNDMIEAQRPKTLAEKATALHREFILSGYSVFSKLFGATAWNIPVETLADTFGAGIGRAVKIGGTPLRDIAAREGEMSFPAAMEHLKGLMSKEALDNAVQVAKTGINDIFQTAGYKAKKAELGGYLGRIHGFEKSFLQTAEFKKSFYMRLAKISRLGGDPNSPESQFQASMGAANDAIGQILQSDNKASQFVNTLVGAAGRVHPVAGAVARTLVPITRVPANYLGRAIQMTGLGIPEGAIRQINASIKAGKGVEITPQEADAIGRAYKYGGVGLVAMYIGLNQPDWFKASGYYAGPGKKGNPDSTGKPMNTGSIEMFGVHVPHLVAHSPFVEAVQFWSSIRRASQAGEPRLQTAITGLAGQAPGALSVEMMQSAGERGGIEGAGGEYARSLMVPQLVQQIAKEQDKPPNTPWYDMFVNGERAQYRHPKGFTQEIQYGLPRTPINPQFNRLTLPTSVKKSKPLVDMSNLVNTKQSKLINLRSRRP